MSTATITRVTPDPRRDAPPLRRPARSKAVRGPLARPVRVVPPPASRSGERSAVRSCRLEAAAERAEWRLTDRGIALVLVLAVMIAVAAVVVIGLTAWQVTGADYAAWSGPVSRR